MEKIKVAWEGDFFINHSLAIVNRNVCQELIKNIDIDLSIITSKENIDNYHEFSDLFPLITESLNKVLEPDFIIRFQWPPNFINESKKSKLIIIQPWEFGSMPKDWFLPFVNEAFEIWTHSNENKKVYASAGIPDEKIKVIPLGIKKDDFIKSINPLQLNTTKKFKFLFNGGAIFRKGIDILLEAYTKEFNKNEDVCLVIKDIGVSNIYLENYQKEIQDKIQDKNNPEILYLNENYSNQDVLSLYKASDCYVHPYRGEGFGLPIVEAMASGIPVITTEKGSSEDFCHPDLSYLIKTDILKFDVKAFSVIETLDYPYFFEPKVDSLTSLMRNVFENREEAKNKAAKAKSYILDNFTWENTSNAIHKRLKELSNNTSSYTKTFFNEVGIELYNNREYGKSINFFSSMLSVSDNNSDNYYYLGLSLFKKDAFKEAIDAFSKAYKLNPQNKACIEYLASCMEKLGDFNTANILRKR